MPDLIYVLIKGLQMLELLLSIPNHKNTFIWTTKSKWPVSLRDPATAAVSGLIVTFGGTRLQEGSETYDVYTYSNTLIVYDIATGGSARTTAPILGRTSAHAAGIGNKFYVMGGYFSGSGSDYSLHEYNTSTGVWTTRAAVPGTYSVNSMTAHNGYLYATIYDVSIKWSRLYRWNPITPNNGWVEMARAPAQEYSAGKLFGIDNYIYYFGGRLSGSLAAVVFRYNIDTNNWSILPQMPAGFDAVYPTAINNSIYLLKPSTVAALQVYSYVDGGQPVLVDSSPGSYNPVAAFGVTAWNNKTYLIGGLSQVAPVGLTDQCTTIELR